MNRKSGKRLVSVKEQKTLHGGTIMTKKAFNLRRNGKSLSPGMKMLLMLLTVIFAVSFYGTADAAIPAAERTALLDLYASTTGTAWTNSTGWNGPEGTECTWYGVICGGGANVTILNLYSNNLNGSIPASISNFSRLAYLVLNSNRLSGTIPSQLGNMTSLMILNLHSNQLSGTIPSQLGNLTNLKYLHLDSNQLTGAIPSQLGNLTNLQNLYLYSNQLNGSIPSQLGNLTNLKTLDLCWNQLTGTIPAELGSLAGLQYLYLFGNQLSGGIPMELGNLTSLQGLYLNSNQLSGGIPVELGNLTSLTNLHLESNQLSGTIPVELGNLAGLQYLLLDHNQISGAIPSQLGTLTGLTTLNLESNRLTGAVPSSFSNLAALSTGGLDLRWNALYTSDASLKTFLDSKQVFNDWVSTETIAPTNLGVTGAAGTSITLTWTPIAYTGDGGGYEVYYSAAPGEAYSLFETTEDKSATTSTVTGLVPGNTYYFKVRTKTELHSNNMNTVYSEYSPEVSGITGPNIAVTDSVPPTGDFTIPFGSITEGNTSDQTVTVTNSGNANLVMGTIASANPLAAPFSITADNCSNQTIAPAGTCTLTVRFAPAAVGSFSDAFDIPSNDPDTATVTISVSGTGTAVPVPDIAVTDSITPDTDLQMAFGNVTQGVTSFAQTVTIANAGSADLVVSSIQLSGTDAGQFNLDLNPGSNSCGSPTPTIAAGANCTVTVAFSPTATGNKSATLAISSGDPDEATVNITLTGTGLSNAGNNAPAAPALVSPANGQTGLSTAVEFKWKKVTDPDGDTVTYRLSYCTDPSFTGCTPVDVASSNKVYFAGLGMYGGLMIFGTVFAGTRRGRMAMLLLIMIVLLCTGSFLAACGGGGGGSGASNDVTYSASGLAAGTTYYWKVVADDGKGGTAESAVWSFSRQ